MDPNRTKGNAEQLKGKLKEAAGELTDDQSLKNKGRAEQLGGKIREGYGKVKDEIRAEKERQDEEEVRTYDPDDV